jgi:hypothetical protein
MVFDVTCCADVMEHVPEEFVPQVLTEIGNYTKEDGAMIFSISSNPAKKMFKDGENLHATIKDLNWWVVAIRQYCGDKSFLLIQNDDNLWIEPTSVTVERREQLLAAGKKPTCNTSLRFYNSSKFNVWQYDAVQNAYYTDVDTGEVK